MLMLTRFRSRKYLQRIVLSLVLFVIVVLGVFSFTLYWNMKNATLNTLSEANRKVLAQVKYNVEYMDEIAKNLTMSLYFDNEVIPMLYGKEFDYGDIAFKLWKLDKIVDSSTYLHSITLYNAFTGTYLSTNRSFQDNIHGEIERYEQQLEEQQDLSKLAMIPIKLSDEAGSDVDFFSYVMYEQHRKQMADSSKLIVNVKSSWLFNNINMINNLAYEQSNALLLLDGSGRVYAGENGMLHELPPELIERMTSSAAEFESFTFGQGKDKSIVTMMPLGVYNWKLASIQSYDVALAPLDIIRRILVLSTVLFLALSAAIAFIISQRLYKPVDTMMRQLRDSASQAGEELDANKDEWSYLSNVYTNLVHRVNKVKQHYSKNKSIIAHFQIRNLLTDSARLPRQKFIQIIHELDSKIAPEGPFIVCAIAIDDYAHKIEKISSEERDLYVFAIGNIAEELLAAQDHSVWTYMGEGLFLFLLTPDSTADRERIVASAEEAQQVIQTYYGLSLTISLSAVYDSYTHITDAYVEARDLILYRMLYGRRAIVTAELVNRTVDKTALPGVTDLERRIVDELRKGDGPELERQLQLFFGHACTLTYNEFMQVTLHLTMTVAKAVQELNDTRLSPTRLQMVNLYKEVLEKETAEEIKEIFLAIAAHLSEAGDAEAFSKSEMICQTIREIIEENCTHPDFYQQTIAQMLKMSSAYIGRLFKQRTGMSITEYLNDVRLGKAQTLLEADNITINEIMERVGYRSQSHFFKLFKLKYGTSPKEYRLKKAMSAGAEPGEE
ncbi:AraC family transcriptional regulator [Paenibacillaceae bacterium]|nr:AraC family transcriptional regulator [Paenibacillaceae bacterium]